MQIRPQQTCQTQSAPAVKEKREKKTKQYKNNPSSKFSATL